MGISHIVLGASAGGINALQSLLSQLDENFKAPIVVVLHRDREKESEFSKLFSAYYHGTVNEVKDKTLLEASNLYIAPRDYHLLIEDDKTLALSVEKEVNFSRPSIDILFESAARSLKKNVCGVLLTGANDDGAEGLAFIKENGGMTVVQSPAEAEHARMPQAALERFGPSMIGKISEISSFLNGFKNE